MDAATATDERRARLLRAACVEAQVDAGVRAGHARRSWPPSSSSRRWPARPRCCARRGGDTLAARREVTSPGGSTARGLAALERAGVRAAFPDAMDAVVRPMTSWPPTRDDIADYVGTLFFVYSLLIIAYIVMSLFFAFGGRIAVLPLVDAVLGFLRDVSEPYLRSSAASSRRSARWTSARSSR